MTVNLIICKMWSSVEPDSINCVNICLKYIGRNLNADLTPFPFSFS